MKQYYKLTDVYEARNFMGFYFDKNEVKLAIEERNNDTDGECCVVVEELELTEEKLNRVRKYISFTYAKIETYNGKQYKQVKHTILFDVSLKEMFELASKCDFKIICIEKLKN